ncbi:MAG: hypothetical protein GY948_17015 [Alphaproteobacteria bacterium]|nr:hypothetical protein [Alphaproteobacteria bacterium]
MTLLGYNMLIWIPVLAGLLGLGTVTCLLQNAKTRYLPWRDLFVAWLFSALVTALPLLLFAWLLT